MLSALFAPVALAVGITAAVVAHPHVITSGCEAGGQSGLCSRPGNSTYPGPAYDMTQQQYGIGPGAIIGPFGAGPMPPVLMTN